MSYSVIAGLLFAGSTLLAGARRPEQRTTDPGKATKTRCLSPEAMQAQMEALFAPSPAVQATIHRLEGEIEGLRGHPWAGAYYYGDHLGLNVHLWITPNGFASTTSGCGGIYAQFHGGVTRAGNILQLDPVPPEDALEEDYLPARLTPVAVESGVYLIRPTEREALERHIATPADPRWGGVARFLLRK